jgi:MurNAc alpha-1-phosphate uridylyltransferase
VKTMILAAGMGRRLRPLTESTPKPLIEICGETLLGRHLKKLKRAGHSDVIINISHLGDKIERHVGDGSQFGVKVQYSWEIPDPLETAGGIRKALPLLGNDPFIVINGDIWTSFDYSELGPLLKEHEAAHLIVVPKDKTEKKSDFSYRDGFLIRDNHNILTYAGIGVFRPNVFPPTPVPITKLAPLLFDLADEQSLGGTIYTGDWFDIGTPARLERASRLIEEKPPSPNG